MISIAHYARLAASLATTFLIIGCAQPGAGGPGDGTWTGAADNKDFNMPGNWSPTAVPTGTATVNAPDSTHMAFSAASTSLGAIDMVGMATLTLPEGKSAGLAGRGLTLCCAIVGQVFINGTFSGNISFGDQNLQTFRLVGGNGTITGTITQTNGTLLPGGGESVLVMRTMTLKGNYLLSRTGALRFGVYSDRPTSKLVVLGSATLGGGVLVIDPSFASKAPLTFTAMTAAQGIKGNFSSVQSTDPDYTVSIDFQPRANPTDLVVSIAPKTR